jgi:hypothetical protein
MDATLDSRPTGSAAPVPEMGSPEGMGSRKSECCRTIVEIVGREF